MKKCILGLLTFASLNAQADADFFYSCRGDGQNVLYVKVIHADAYGNVTVSKYKQVQKYKNWSTCYEVRDQRNSK